MVSIVVRLADLDFLSPLDLSGEQSAAQIAEAIRRQFDYLPGELVIEIKDGVATVQFEEASVQAQAEARRLFEKAGKRAKIGMLGQRGLDYADPMPKYTLQTMPGESFTGLQLMCLMHAGFKRIAPEHDTGMDLDEPFLTALELHQNGKGDTDAN